MNMRYVSASSTVEDGDEVSWSPFPSVGRGMEIRLQIGNMSIYLPINKAIEVQETLAVAIKEVTDRESTPSPLRGTTPTTML